MPDAPDARVLTRTADVPCRPTKRAGVEWKPLRYVEGTGAGAVLLRMAPGCAYPSHRHMEGEDVYVLEGEMVVGTERLAPGAYLYSPPGSVHAPRTEKGCVLLSVFAGHVNDL